MAEWAIGGGKLASGDITGYSPIPAKTSLRII
jgi:hypothetical protein